MPQRYELLPTSDSPRSYSPVPPYSLEDDDDDEGLALRTNSPLYENLLNPNSSRFASGHSHDVEYEALATPRNRETREAIRAFHADPRFNPPAPSPWARLALISGLIFMFYMAFVMRKAIWVDFGMGRGDPQHIPVGHGLPY